MAYIRSLTVYQFSSKEMDLKMATAKYWPFAGGLSGLIFENNDISLTKIQSVLYFLD